MMLLWEADLKVVLGLMKTGMDFFLAMVYWEFDLRDVKDSAHKKKIGALVNIFNLGGLGEFS